MATDASIVLTDFDFEVSRGNIPGVSSNNKFGFNPDIGTASDPETLWAPGGQFKKQLLPETVNLSSTSINDTLLGSGARIVLVSYLTEEYVQIDEFYELNGTTNVPLNSPCIAINRMVVLAAGSSSQNEGAISALGADTADIHANIPLITDEGDVIGASITQQLVYTVPAGRTVYIDKLLFNVIKVSGGGQNPEVTIRGILKNEVGIRLVWFHQKIDAAIANTVPIIFPTAIPIGEKITISLDALTDTNNTYIGGRFWYKEETN